MDSAEPATSINVVSLVGWTYCIFKSFFIACNHLIEAGLRFHYVMALCCGYSACAALLRSWKIHKSCCQRILWVMSEISAFLVRRLVLESSLNISELCKSYEQLHVG